ncbi:MAG: hypothetical protein LBU26_06625 [Synergistaceae bacterium]|nr:hypothetical protein [Synergistaceae bacterium]
MLVSLCPCGVILAATLETLADAFQTSGEWIAAAADNFDGGNGTRENPYRIATPEQLAHLAKIVTDDNFCGGAHFKLTSDIDLTGKRWTPIGPMTGDAGFAGQFDGGGHSITGLKIVASDDAGLFRTISAEGAVSNLRVSSADVTGKNRVGVIASRNIGTVTNCRADGVVSGNSFVGGIAGSNLRSVISSSTWGGSVWGNTIGGIAGFNLNGTLKFNKSSGKFTGKDYIGAICGLNAGVIDSCSAEGVVSGELRIGGIAGVNFDKISHCESNATVTGGRRSSAGGIAGANRHKESSIKLIFSSDYAGQVLDHGFSLRGSDYARQVLDHGFSLRESSIENCAANGAVHGAFAGGIAAINAGASIRGCTVKMNVSGKISSGGVVAANKGRIENCTAEGDVTCMAFPGGIAGWNINDYAGLLVDIRGRGEIKGCFARNRVTAANNNKPLDAFTSALTFGMSAGGIAGVNEYGAAVMDCSYDADISGQRREIGFDEPLVMYESMGYLLVEHDGRTMILLLVIGAVTILATILYFIARHKTSRGKTRGVWLRNASALVLAINFALVAWLNVR